MQAAGDADGPDPVAEVALQLAEDRWRGEGGEGRAAIGIETVDRVDEAEARHLQQVVEGLAGPAIAQRQVFREGQVATNQLLANRRVAVLDEPGPERALAGQALAGARGRLVWVFPRLFAVHSIDRLGGDTCPTSLPLRRQSEAVRQTAPRRPRTIASGESGLGRRRRSG